MLFNEPTLRDLELAWHGDRAHFYTDAWQDTGRTPAEWAWLVESGTFWDSSELRSPGVPLQHPTWWDWMCSNVKGPAMASMCQSLLLSKVYPSAGALTNYIAAYAGQKTGQSLFDIECTIDTLSTSTALQYVGPSGQTPMAAVCAAKHPGMLRKLVSCYAAAGVPWDVAGYQRYHPLHFAVANEWAAGVKILIDSGADQAATNSEGFTAAQQARAHDWLGYPSTSQVAPTSKLTKTKTPLSAVQPQQADMFGADMLF